MNGLTKGILKGIFTGLEITSALLLAGFALKADNERHKAVIKLCDKEIELGLIKIDSILKDAKIRMLEEKLKELQNDEES